MLVYSTVKQVRKMKGFVLRVVHLAAVVALVAVVLGLALPGGAVAVLVAAPLAGASWTGLFTLSVLALVVVGVVANEVRRATPRD